MSDLHSKYITIDPDLKKAVNDRLRLDAIKNYKAMMELGRTDYSRKDLAALEHEVEQARSEKDVKFDLDIIDVNKLTILRALGLDIKKAVDDQGLAGIMREEKEKPGRLKYFQDGIAAINRDKVTGSTSTSTFPESYLDDKILVPMTPYGQKVEIRGFSYLENTVFFNTHEEHHFMDKTIDNSTEAGRMKAEAFADVAALGEMLVKGFREGIIDDVIARRAGDGASAIEARKNNNKNPVATDLSHMSALTLEAFKKELQVLEKDGKTGVDALKSMTEAERMELYHRLTDDNAFSSDIGVIEIGFVMKAKPSERTDLEERAKDDPELQKAILFVKETEKYTAYNAIKPSDAEIAQKKEIAATVNAWDAQKDLIDAAFAKGRVTPENVVAAYTEIQNKLLAEMNSNPATSELCQQKLVKMENVLTQNLLKIDYVDENDKRGVDITKDSKFAKQPAPEKKATVKTSVKKPAVQNLSVKSP